MEIERQWPELFEGVSPGDAAVVREAVANAQLGDGAPVEREAVVDLVDYVTGRIDAAEYDRRGIARILG